MFCAVPTLLPNFIDIVDAPKLPVSIEKYLRLNIFGKQSFVSDSNRKSREQKNQLLDVKSEY